MRGMSLVGLVVALVVVGLLVKRQLSAVRAVAPQPAAHRAPTAQPPVTEQVREAMDQITRQRQAELEQAEQATR